MNLLEKIDLFLGEEMTAGSVGTSTTGDGYVATTTSDIAKFPEKFVVGMKRRKKKKKKYSLEDKTPSL